MPLFGWMKWTWGKAESTEAGAESSCVLMRELLRYMEERQRLACDMERQHQQTQGMMGYRRVQSYPIPRPPIPPSERRALECLCAQIRPANTAAVLSRCHEVLTAHNILPWELVYVFKQVLRDFLDEEEEGTSRFQVKRGITVPTSANGSEPLCKEIPTISSYVDKRMRGVRPYEAPRDWDLPYGYPGPI
uniref:RD3 like n=2 Tax=Paramormyrops kingsleyae TaxID=1676925 RepID=A0A3B3TCW5_9TELE